VAVRDEADVDETVAYAVEGLCGTHRRPRQIADLEQPARLALDHGRPFVLHQLREMMAGRRPPGDRENGLGVHCRTEGHAGGGGQRRYECASRNHVCSPRSCIVRPVEDHCVFTGGDSSSARSRAYQSSAGSARRVWVEKWSSSAYTWDVTSPGCACSDSRIATPARMMCGMSRPPQLKWNGVVFPLTNRIGLASASSARCASRYL